MSVDEARLVRGQEQHGLRLLDGLAKAAGGEVDLAPQPFGDVVAEPVLQQGGVEGGGAEAVEAEALAGVDDGELAGEGEHGALGGGVGELRGGGADEGDDGGGVDDAAAGLFVAAEREHGVLAAVPDALHVDGHGQVPDVLGGADGVVVARVHYARVVEDDVQPAPGVEGFNGGFYLVFFGDVAGLDGGEKERCVRQLTSLSRRRRRSCFL